jgi:hypothetical protein
MGREARVKYAVGDGRRAFGRGRAVSFFERFEMRRVDLPGYHDVAGERYVRIGPRGVYAVEAYAYGYGVVGTGASPASATLDAAICLREYLKKIWRTGVDFRPEGG